jgi:hypothetical protein
LSTREEKRRMISKEVREINTPIIQGDTPSETLQFVIERLLYLPPCARALYEAACAVEANRLSDLPSYIETVMKAFPIISRELV